MVLRLCPACKNVKVSTRASVQLIKRQNPSGGELIWPMMLATAPPPHHSDDLCSGKLYWIDVKNKLILKEIIQKDKD